MLTAAWLAGGISASRIIGQDLIGPQDRKAEDGYVRQDYAIAEIERVGFALVASSEIEANPRVTTLWSRGVWTLPPTYRLGALDHDKYQKVGEADNFLLKFRKVRQ